jgi:hypothetical protein
MKIIRYGFLSFVLFLIYGCASTPILPETLTHADLEHDNGILVGSISRESGDWPYYNYGIFFRRIGGKKRHVIEVIGEWAGYWSWRSEFSDDFKAEDASGSLFAYILQAGDYEIYQYFLRSHTGPQERVFRARKDFSIKFTIRPGEIGYIGEFLGQAIMAKDIIGIPVAVGGNWRLRNRFTRDIPLLTQKFLDINFIKTIKYRPLGCANINDC